MNASRLTSRREFLGLSVAAVVGTAFTPACSTATPPSPAPSRSAPTATTPALWTTANTPMPQPAAALATPPAASTRMAFWWTWWGDLEVASTKAVVRRFEDKNPKVVVDTTQNVGFDMLVMMLASGTPPDLFEWGPPAEFAAKGQLIPLDDLLVTSKAISKSMFLDSSLKEGSWQGKLFGLPALEHFTNLTTVVNEDLFQQSGLKVPDDLPMTLEDALRQGKEYTKLDQAGNIDLLWYAFANLSLSWLAASYGTKVYD